MRFVPALLPDGLASCGNLGFVIAAINEAVAGRGA